MILDEEQLIEDDDCNNLEEVVIARSDDISLPLEVVRSSYKQLEKDIQSVENITRRKTLIFQAYNCKRSFCQNLDLLQPPKEVDESTVDKAKFLKAFPRSYLLFSTVSLFFCLPIGILAVWHSKKVCCAVKFLNRDVNSVLNPCGFDSIYI